MEELLDWMEYIEDMRQARKVCHKLKNILAIVFFAISADVNDWVEMEFEYFENDRNNETGIFPKKVAVCD